MKKANISYFCLGKEFEAHVAFPEEESEISPVVFVLHAWAGRDSFACSQAAWLAELGYLGVALDVYGKRILGTNARENSALMNPLLEDRSLLYKRMMSGIEAVLEKIENDGTHMAAMGFCFGGLAALDLARRNVPLKGVVSFHGLLTPLSSSSSSVIEPEILVFHGEEDPMVSSEALFALKQEMKERKANWQICIYGNARHAFTNPEANDPKNGILYHSAAAYRSKEMTRCFFEQLFL